MQNKQETSELIERFIRGELQSNELDQLKGLLSSEKRKALKEEILFPYPTSGSCYRTRRAIPAKSIPNLG